MDSQSVLSVREISAGYDGTTALEEISFELPPSTLVGLAGPNGSGKSTLLKTILGLVTPWKGSIELFGKPLNGSRNRVGYAPQSELVDWDFPVSALDA